MAGVIAAADNDFGIAGVAPAARIYALKVFPRTGGALTSNIIRAVDWAIANGMDVVSCSFGADKPTAIEEAAFERARRANVLVIAATGNEGTFVRYPAGYSSVVAVGAVTRSLAVASFSNRGEAIDLVAPGTDIVSTMRSGLGLLATVTTADGTYIAAPIRNSPSGMFAGAAVDCGGGDAAEVPASVSAQIAVMRHGAVAYNSMTANAMRSGAVALVFVDEGPDDRALNLVIAEGSAWPVSVSIGSTAGAHLDGEVAVDSYISDYENAHGTSMAAPFVAGVAALVRSVRHDLTADEVAALLLRTAHDIGEPGCDAVSGCGLVDAFAAVVAATPPQPVRRRSSRS
jgi:subtilisin family serine protease